MGVGYARRYAYEVQWKESLLGLAEQTYLRMQKGVSTKTIDWLGIGNVHNFYYNCLQASTSVFSHFYTGKKSFLVISKKRGGAWVRGTGQRLDSQPQVVRNAGTLLARVITMHYLV